MLPSVRTVVWPSCSIMNTNQCLAIILPEWKFLPSPPIKVLTPCHDSAPRWSPSVQSHSGVFAHIIFLLRSLLISLCKCHRASAHPESIIYSHFLWRSFFTTDSQLHFSSSRHVGIWSELEINSGKIKEHVDSRFWGRSNRPIDSKEDECGQYNSRQGCLHSTQVGNISWVHRALEQGVIVLELLERCVRCSWVSTLLNIFRESRNYLGDQKNANHKTATVCPVSVWTLVSFKWGTGVS